MTPFHLAFPVTDLEATERFYVDLLGCRVGRRDAKWIDFDFHGHQISAHLIDAPLEGGAANEVDGDQVPVRHFGAVLAWDAWEAMAAKLEAAGVAFSIAPRVRFEGEPGEQRTMFFFDPSGNPIEIKGFADFDGLFAK